MITIDPVDVVLALRLLYYSRGVSLVSDLEYDSMERDARKLSGGEVLDSVGSDNQDDYPKRVVALAEYLVLKTKF